MADSDRDTLQKAIGLHQQGRIADAERLYRQILAGEPEHFGALHLLGVIRHQQGRSAEALELIEKALAVNARSARALSNHGLVLYGLGREAEALASFDRALALEPAFVDALANRAQLFYRGDRHEAAVADFDRLLAIRQDYAEGFFLRGNALAQLRRHEEALASYDRALALGPGIAEIFCNRGNALAALGRHAEALASYERAIALKPGYAEAIGNCGNVLSALARHDDALARFDEALAMAPRSAVTWYNRGNALSVLRRFGEALTSYDQALAVAPGYAEALDNRGNALLNLNRREEALASFEAALKLDPGNCRILNNRGSALSALNRYGQALASYDEALGHAPGFVDALTNRGNALKGVKRYDEAIASYEQALAIDPDNVDAAVGVADAALSMCDWARTEALAGKLAAQVNAGRPTVGPFTLLAYCDDPALHRKCAEAFVAERMPVKPEPLWTGPAVHRDKIRVAYLSADFRRHATAYLVAELFELHDRARFDIVGVGFDVDDGSEVRRRLVAAFDEFHDVHTCSDREVAQLLNDRNVDIAVDLKGHTGDARLGIFAHRGAPIQVSYLGYPGTVGADFIDYLIADDVVAPRAQAPFYSEKIVQLPDCYQVNDSKRTIAETAPSRTEAGLPTDGFVFCCFNNNYKITAPVFDVWMRLMQAVPGSVLWLLRDSAGAERNLRREAQARGVDPGRLVFAGRTDLAGHLARHRLADLFLDTLPYNAHTTASDALWAGLPMVTCQGQAFAGRVGASLLRAAGLPELVTTTLPDYERLALRLATDKAALGALRETLARNRDTCPLFDTEQFCRNIQAAYGTMVDIWRRGEPPRSFAVPA